MGHMNKQANKHIFVNRTKAQGLKLVGKEQARSLEDEWHWIAKAVVSWQPREGAEDLKHISTL